MVLRSQVLGCGAYLPERVMTNDDLSRIVDTSDEWIFERSGIRQRHIAAAGEFTSALATRAARAALENAETSPSEVDFIVLATTTPDETFPATATRVQAALGITRGFAFDIQAVCSGFVYALAVVDNFLKSGHGRTALVIGAETFSRLLDWKDRNTCVLFGDGAGALVFRACEGKGGVEDRGILATHLHSDGRDHDSLYTDGGPSSTGAAGFVRMNGQEVFKKAVIRLADVAREVIESTGITAEDIDWLVPHQANLRIMQETMRRLGLPGEKLLTTIDRHANTSAASIPLALTDGWNSGKIREGQLLLLEAIGGGLTWGSSLLRW